MVTRIKRTILYLEVILLPRTVSIEYFIMQAVQRHSASKYYKTKNVAGLIEETKEAYNICVEDEVSLLSSLRSELDNIFG